MTTATLPAAVDTALSLRPHGSSKRFIPKSKFGPLGLAVMVAAHVLIGYALATGLAQQVFEVVKKPLTATIIDEVKLPPPPPPPPPKIEKMKEAPKLNTPPPPPAYVPPPDVPVPVAAPVPTITAVQSTQAVAPPPAAPPPPPAAIPAPATPMPLKADIALACPKQVKPDMPQKALDDGIEGTVKAEVHVRNGKVVEIRILSGPRIYHAVVRAAMLRYECVNGDAEVIATQDFTFKLD